VTERSRDRLVPGTSPDLVEQDEPGLAVGNADRESDSGRETRPGRLVAADHRGTPLARRGLPPMRSDTVKPSALPLAEPLVGVKEVAAILGVPTSWVYAAGEAGTLPSYRIGKYRRFRPSEIAAWLEPRRTRAPSPNGGEQIQR
jgi:excisionase family DNA binding protein